MPENGHVSLSAEVFKYWLIDHEKGKTTVVHQDGTSFSDTLPVTDQPAGIRASFFDWDNWWVGTITTRGHLVYTMGFNATNPNRAPNRPTVYLDQNMWSLLASAMAAPERIKSERELRAAREIIRLATDDGIILPLSNGHLLETTALHTDRRYEVGIAQAHLSGGWQMRHPLDVLEEEARREFSTRLPNTAEARAELPVLTTAPAAWKRDWSTVGIDGPPQPTVQTFLDMLTAPGVMIALLIDPDPIAPTMQSRWVARQQATTQQFCDLRGLKSEKCSTALRRFWNENIQTFHAAARSANLPDAPLMSTRELHRFLTSGPMSTLLSGLFTARYIDKSNRWNKNDLVDIYYLSCGAAYCDYVAGETKTTTQIAQIQRSQSLRVNAFRSLGDLVAALHNEGVTTDTERRTAASSA